MNLRTVGRMQNPDFRRDVSTRGRYESVAVSVLNGNSKAGDGERDARERKRACGDHHSICNQLAE